MFSEPYYRRYGFLVEFILEYTVYTPDTAYTHGGRCATRGVWRRLYREVRCALTRPGTRCPGPAGLESGSTRQRTGGGDRAQAQIAIEASTKQRTQNICVFSVLPLGSITRLPGLALGVRESDYDSVRV